MVHFQITKDNRAKAGSSLHIILVEAVLGTGFCHFPSYAFYLTILEGASKVAQSPSFSHWIHVFQMTAFIRRKPLSF